ncbi:MAG: twin-arginine translocation signal domain-containing protein, partial [Burkholderiales bacterium]
MNRRRFLSAGAGVIAAAGLGGCRYWPEQGLWNPCLAERVEAIANHELVRAAWQGIDPDRVWDSHVHLVGTGDSGSGIRVNPRMSSLLDPAQYARRMFIVNAGCVHTAPEG